MRFDTIIIGGGLAGIACGVKLQQRGLRTLIASRGQSAMLFLSGSLELLGKREDGTVVGNPCAEVAAIVATRPGHPYAKIGAERFPVLAGESRILLESAGIAVSGSHTANHFRISPFGNPMPAWLTFEGYACSPDAEKLPWRKAAVVAFRDYLDFYPHYIAAEFGSRGCSCSVSDYRFSGPDQPVPREMRSAYFSRMANDPEELKRFAGWIGGRYLEEDVVVIPNAFGPKNMSALERLRQESGKEIVMVSAMPPTVSGVQFQDLMVQYYRSLGGHYLHNDTVESAEVSNGVVKSVRTENFAGDILSADTFVLAAGSFFNEGLKAGWNEVTEPLFDADVEYSCSREDWFGEDSLAAQPYQSFGVKTDERFRVMRGGVPFGNLYAIGNVLGGFNPIFEGCGGGVAMLSALSVAEDIAAQKKGVAK